MCLPGITAGLLRSALPGPRLARFVTLGYGLFGFTGFALFGQNSPGIDAAQVERGSTLFKSNCGFCHGDDATGNRGPDLIRSVALGHDVNGDVLDPLIRNGRPDKGMPGFSTLTAPQIADMVVFLHRQAEAALYSSRLSSRETADRKCGRGEGVFQRSGRMLQLPFGHGRPGRHRSKI
jgi:mono/diheme cytochrome c family protein